LARGGDGYRSQDLIALLVLQQQPARACMDRFHEILLGRGGDDQHTGPGGVSAKSSDGIDGRDSVHSGVHQDHRWLGLHGQPDDAANILGLSQDIDPIALQVLAKAAPEHGVIVGDQDPDSGCRRAWVPRVQGPRSASQVYLGGRTGAAKPLGCAGLNIPTDPRPAGIG